MGEYNHKYKKRIKNSAVIMVYIKGNIPLQIYIWIKQLIDSKMT